MIDQRVFPQDSPAGLAAAFRERLPDHVTVELKEGKKTELAIQDGAWRKAILALSRTDENRLLAVRSYRIATFPAKVLLFVASVVVSSLFFSIVVSVAVGDFVPMWQVGGLAGLITYNWVEAFAFRGSESLVRTA